MLWSLMNGKLEISCIMRDVAFELKLRPKRTPEMAMSFRVMNALCALVIYHGRLERGGGGTYACSASHRRRQICPDFAQIDVSIRRDVVFEEVC